MIVVFGSINIDIAIQVDRLPQAGETLLGRDLLVSPGGKGANQAHAARLAGAEVKLFGCVGRDDFAAPALASLRAAGVDLTGLAEAPVATGCATIWLSDGGISTIVAVPGANWRAAQAGVPDEVLTPDSVLVLQQEVPPEQNWHLIERAKAAGMRIVFNAAPGSPVPPEALAALDVLVVNEIEIRQLAEALGARGTSDGMLPDWLSGRFGLTVIATHGAEGLVCRTPERAIRLPAVTVVPLDTTGAGDTFVGVFAACLDRGLELEAALQHANRAAALCCTRPGAQAAQPKWDDYGV